MPSDLPTHCPNCDESFGDDPFDYDSQGNDLFFCTICRFVWAQIEGDVIPANAGGF